MMRKTVAALLFWSTAAWAQGETASLEELLRQEPDRPSANVTVSTATRLPQGSAQAPGVTRVVTRLDIQRLGLRTLPEVLRLFPGLYLTQDDLFTQLGVRGVGRSGDLNARVLFLLDGLRLNENIYDAGQVDEDFLVDVSEIERVEYTSGSGSALYGNNAFLGVIQVFTRRSSPEAGMRVRVRWDAPQRYAAHWSAGHRLDSGAEWGLALTQMRAKRQDLHEAWPGYPPGELSRLNDDRSDKFGVRWIQGALNARAGAVDRIKGLPVELGISKPIGLGKAQDRTRIHWGQLQWDGALGEAAWVQLGLAHQQLLYRYDEPFQTRSGRRGTFRFETLGRWGQLELRAGGSWLETHEWMLGLEAQRDRRQRIRYFVLGEDESGDDARNQRWGLWVQDLWRVSEKQQWVLGWRADRVQGQGLRAHPRLAYAWAPGDGQQFKLSYGSAFRAPNRSEVLTNSFQDLPAPPAERVRALELAWETPLGDRWRGRWVAYLGRVRNLIDFSGDQGFYSASPSVRTQGLEMELEGRWGSGGSLHFSMTTQRARYADGRALSNSPRAEAKWRLSHPFWGSWRVSVHGEALGARQVEDLRIPGYGLLHATLLWQVEDEWDFFLGLRNLRGKAYTDAPSVPGGQALIHRGREAYMGVEWRFRP